MSNSPTFATLPEIGMARLTAANTANDGSGTLSTLVVGRADTGSVVDQVRFAAAQAVPALTSAKVGMLFIDNGAGVIRYIDSIAMGAETPSNIVPPADYVINFATAQGGLWVPPGYMLKCKISVRAGANDDTDVTAYGGKL